MTYLPGATNFDGLELKPPPHERYPDIKGRDYICPVCQGHGSWNTKLNAYGPGRHFKAHCRQCNGWGWVAKHSKDCVHAFVELLPAECKEKGYHHYGKFCHVYECTKCQYHYSADSSG